MVLATWWFDDRQPSIESVTGLTVECPPDDGVVSCIASLPLDEIARRKGAANRPYVARVDGVPAAYGWIAERTALIGELRLSFEIPPGNRYLWDFATLHAFRGRAIYPSLLAEIVRQECPPARRLWIIHAPENLPSGVGMTRAGFQPVAELSFDAERRPSLAPLLDGERAVAASELLGLPLAHEPLDPCWACDGSCDHSDGSPTSCECTIVPKR